jgi:hypothetical protein
MAKCMGLPTDMDNAFSSLYPKCWQTTNMDCPFNEYGLELLVTHLSEA